MKIAKVINNNVISVLEPDGSELVIMGTGLAYQKKPGQEVDQQKIQKVFALKNKETSDNFKMLLREVPVDHMVAVEEIITYAKNKLDKKLNENIYVP